MCEVDSCCLSLVVYTGAQPVVAPVAKINRAASELRYRSEIQIHPFGH